MKTKPLRRSRVERIVRTLKMTDPFARSYPLRQQIPQQVNSVDLPPAHRQHHAGFPPLVGTNQRCHLNFAEEYHQFIAATPHVLAR